MRCWLTRHVVQELWSLMMTRPVQLLMKEVDSVSAFLSWLYWQPVFPDHTGDHTQHHQLQNMLHFNSIQQQQRNNCLAFLCWLNVQRIIMWSCFRHISKCFSYLKWSFWLYFLFCRYSFKYDKYISRTKCQSRVLWQA